MSKFLLIIFTSVYLLNAQIRIPGPGGYKPSGGGGGGHTGNVTQVCAGNDGAGSATCTGTPTNGHAVVVAAGIYNCTFSGLNPTVTDGTNTYTLITTLLANTGHACTMYFAKCNATISGSKTFTLTTAVSDYIKMHVYDVDSVQTSCVDNAVTYVTDNSFSSGNISNTDNTPPNNTPSPLLTTTSAHEVIFGGFSGVGFTSSSVTSPWVLGYNDDDVTLVPITQDEVYQIVSSTGTWDPTVNWSIPQGSGYAVAALGIIYQ